MAINTRATLITAATEWLAARRPDFDAARANRPEEVLPSQTESVRPQAHGTPRRPAPTLLGYAMAALAGCLVGVYFAQDILHLVARATAALSH